MSDIENADVPWSKAIIMVCTKCSKKIVGNDELAEDFKKGLKSSLRDLKGKSVRVVTSSCLDICPKDQMALAVATRSEGTRALIVDPDIRTETLLNEILRIPGV